MYNENQNCSTSACHPKRCVSWSAVLGGALVGVGLAFLLNLFSIAVGLSALSMDSTTGVTTVAISGLIGVLIATIVSMFVGGATAGCLARAHCPKRKSGAFYGFVSWCVALLIMACFTGHIGRYVATYTSFVTNPSAMPVMVMPMQVQMQAGAQRNMMTPAAAQTMKGPQAQAAQAPTNNPLGIGAFIVFVLFFVGALASCFGGHFGMTCCCKEDSNCERTGSCG